MMKENLVSVLKNHDENTRPKKIFPYELKVSYILDVKDGIVNVITISPEEVPEYYGHLVRLIYNIYKEDNIKVSPSFRDDLVSHLTFFTKDELMKELNIESEERFNKICKSGFWLNSDDETGELPENLVLSDSAKLDFLKKLGLSGAAYRDRLYEIVEFALLGKRMDEYEPNEPLYFLIEKTNSGNSVNVKAITNTDLYVPQAEIFNVVNVTINKYIKEHKVNTIFKNLRIINYHFSKDITEIYYLFETDDSILEHTGFVPGAILRFSDTGTTSYQLEPILYLEDGFKHYIGLEDGMISRKHSPQMDFEEFADNFMTSSEKVFVVVSERLERKKYKYFYTEEFINKLKKTKLNSAVGKGRMKKLEKALKENNLDTEFEAIKLLTKVFGKEITVDVNATDSDATRKKITRAIGEVIMKV